MDQPKHFARLRTHTFCAVERSAKPQLKNAISGQSYRFWDFTISFYSISWWHHLHPLANCVRKAFLHLHFSVWSMLEEVWMSSHSDMLHAFHSFPSVWVANHHHGPMLLPWLSSSRRKIAKPDLQVQVCRCARDRNKQVIIFNGKESSQESCRIWAIHQRRTFCQEMVIV